jgi:outer membrane protein OmpA-like peptidoglycan-associated protein
MKKTIIILLLILSSIELFSQAPIGELDEIYYLPGMDTVEVTRRYGEWWFGITGGVNGDLYFSDFYLPERPDLYNELDIFNTLIDFPASLGSGLFFGLTGDWQPRGEKWGASLTLLLLDYRASSVESDPFKDSVNTRYQSTFDNIYLTISPSAKYYTLLEGLHVFGGLNIELNLSSEIFQRKTFDHSAVIDHDYKKVTSSFSSRFGFHAGVGYDIMIADINKSMRILMTPYASLNGGTNAYTDYGSSRNQLMVRAGVSFKLGFDQIEADTMLFDPDYRLPGAIIASARMRQDEGVLPQVAVKQDYEYAQLNLVERPMAEDIAAVPAATEIEEEARARQRGLVTINPNEKRDFSYDGGIPEKLYQYLESLVAYLEDNPGAKIRVVGHTSPSGNLTQETERSLQKAEAVKRVLMDRGLSDRQVLTAGEGSLIPLPNADNRTEEGQKLNRRVEISIIPP